jgi:hypothetical protein
MPLREHLSDALGYIQANLFPWLRNEIGPLTDALQRVVIVLGFVRVEAHVPMRDGGPGRPLEDRHAIARAVLGLPETRMLIERLQADPALRRICGWGRAGQIPGELTFSRAFAELSQGAIATRMHEALVKDTLGRQLVGHISIGSTAIAVHEAPVKVETPPAPPKRQRGRPKKDEVVPPKPPRRLERQQTMTQSEMLAELPTHCSVGGKHNAKGFKEKWVGYKLHIATADGDIPVACLLTSAHVHDSQVAIPLANMTAARVTSLYDLMDSAYDHPGIAAHSRSLGHVPIIKHQTRRNEGSAIEAEARAKRTAGYVLAKDVRYRQRSASERVNSSLKESCGGRTVNVRGPAKVLCHLTLGLLVVAVEQLVRLIA